MNKENYSDIISAKGSKGLLLRIMDGTFIFRVYSKDHNTFKDYSIRCEDMLIRIEDDDAMFIGNTYIDYTPPAIANI